MWKNNENHKENVKKNVVDDVMSLQRSVLSVNDEKISKKVVKSHFYGGGRTMAMKIFIPLFNHWAKSTNMQASNRNVI